MTNAIRIPPKESRPQFARPPLDLLTGNNIIEHLAYASYHALPNREYDKLSAQPLTSHRYEETLKEWNVKINTVSNSENEKITSLQPPYSLFTMNWVGPMRKPKYIQSSSFSKDSILSACAPSYIALADMLQELLSFTSVGGTSHELGIFTHFLLGDSDHKVDVVLAWDGSVASAVAHKATLSSEANIWEKFPFGGAVTSKLFSQLDDGAKCLLEEIIVYSSEAKKRSGEVSGKFLAALAIPPLRLHYVLVDFSKKHVRVFPNAVNSSETVITEGQKITDPHTWRAYWKAVVWFCLVVIALNFKEAKDAMITWNSQLPDNKKQLPLDFEEKVNEAVDHVGRAPPLIFWLRFSVWRIRWVHRLTEFFIFLHALWVTLIWQMLGSTRVLQGARYLNIPHGRRLDFGKDSINYWYPTTLPYCMGRWSLDETKYFYVYPQLKVFVKIFTSKAHGNFEAEVRVFNRLSQIQGKGIPILYGSGKVSGREEFFLVMSYEGEPLEEWNEAARSRVEELVTLLHQYHVHHHDIARRNVMVDGSGKITLIDFEHSQEGCTSGSCTENVDLGFPDDYEMLEYLG